MVHSIDIQCRRASEWAWFATDNSVFRLGLGILTVRDWVKKWSPVSNHYERQHRTDSHRSRKAANGPKRPFTEVG